MRFAAVFAPFLIAAASPAVDPVLGSGRGLDHVLLWTGDAEAAARSLRDRFGFEVRQGGDFGNGIANRLVRFPDGSYLELLWLTHPKGALQGDARDAALFLKDGPGANTFALETSDIDGAARVWRARKLDLFPEETLVYDPDGAGPQPAQAGLFRTLFLAAPALRAADLFLVGYRRPRPAAAVQPNGAQGLTAVWLVTPDLAADARRLAELGLRRERAVALPRLGGRGLVFAAGRGHVVLVAPTRAGGRAARALRARPGRILAISIAVADLARARARVESGRGEALSRYQGLWGWSFEVPASPEIGMTVEFHEPPA